jgi:hypothetical protein
MEVNGVVYLAFIYGGLAVIFFTILRYLIPTKIPSSVVRRLLNAIKVIDIRQNKLEVRLMLFQYTGVLYLLFGIVYGCFQKGFEIRGFMGNALELLILFGPGILSGLIFSYLSKTYWR